MEARGKRVAFSKARWARSVRPRRWQRPRGLASHVTHPASTLRQWWLQDQTTELGGECGMQIKTVLNRIQKQRGFVYGPMRLREQGGTLRLEVEIYPHLRNGPRCASCGRTRVPV